MSLYLALFVAGILTILLPCILPLVPIVLGVSVAGRNPWRPFLVVSGMVVSFVGFTLLLNLVLSRFIEAAIIIQTATVYALLLFGASFLFHGRVWPFAIAVAGALFFLPHGWHIVALAAIVGVIAMESGSRIGSRLQQAGADIQIVSRSTFGEGSPITAFIIGLTLGLVWVPCAGPALGFAFALVRNQPGLDAAAALFMYAAGTAVPLLIIGYGGQRAVHSVRAIAPYSGAIKRAAGAVLLITALALHFRLFEKAQVWLLDHTPLGDFGTRLEDRFFGATFERAQKALYSSSAASMMLKPMPASASEASRSSAPAPKDGRSDGGSVSSIMADKDLPDLPKIVRAPELAGLGEWFNSEPLTMAGLKGKVVLIDFWTYSCINCIRTMPYLKQYWASYKDTGKFVLLGIHAPEFVFEKSAANVQDAIDRHGLTYPIAQDNDFMTWRAFANRYWPAKYLIDAEGYIRYTHFGEGGYSETNDAIAALLREADPSMGIRGGNILEPAAGRRLPLTSETYLGERSWPALGNAQGDPTDEVVTYVAPDTLQTHRYYLVGDWQMLDGERQMFLGGDGEIRMRFLGGEINLVLGREDRANVGTADVYIDDVKVKTITIDQHDLYNLYTGTYGEHELRLVFNVAGVSAYAFTFGAGK